MTLCVCMIGAPKPLDFLDFDKYGSYTALSFKRVEIHLQSSVIMRLVSSRTHYRNG